MIKHKNSKRIFSLLLCFCISVLCLTGCTNGTPVPVVPESENLMKGVQRGENAASYDFTQEVQPPEGYQKYTQVLTDFSARLLQGSTPGANTLLSPVCVYLSLAMTANGTDGQSLKECKKVLGGGVISMDNINGCCDYLLQRLTAFNSDDAGLSVANSLWVRDNIDITRNFLQKNANYYSAGAFTEDFSDPATVDKINAWVKEQTNGAIDKVTERIDAQGVLYLISAFALDAPWTTVYTENDVSPGTFYADGREKSVQFMHSEERYIKSDNATGFIKNLDNVPLRFAAVVPNKDLSLDEYVQTLTGTQLTALLESAAATDFAKASMPVFSYSYEQNTKQVLEDMGFATLFTQKADFKKMSAQPVYIRELTHKTYIDVGPQGIKAGAAASAEITSGFSSAENTVLLDRPFLYMLIDNESNIPVLIGTVTEP